MTSPGAGAGQLALLMIALISWELKARSVVVRTLNWQARWVRWPGFGLPADQAHGQEVLAEAWERAGTERVEIACRGGRGRTGTALACLAVIDGVPAKQAVAFVGQHYCPHAAETPWQKRYVSRSGALRHHG